MKKLPEGHWYEFDADGKTPVWIGDIDDPDSYKDTVRKLFA